MVEQIGISLTTIVIAGVIFWHRLHVSHSVLEEKMKSEIKDIKSELKWYKKIYEDSKEENKATMERIFNKLKEISDIKTDIHIIKHRIGLNGDKEK